MNRHLEKIQCLLNYFQEVNPNPQTELNYINDYQLLVAVILSAQCTDKRVNLVTPFLFEKYPNISVLAQAHVEDVFDLIKSISYPNSKSKYLIGMAIKVLVDYQGKIPLEVQELVTLPGVGRKTANVLTSVLAQQPNMAVDTHVFRVAHRIGLVPSTAQTPLAVETALVKIIPKPFIHKMHHWLILHGRYICTAKNPKCIECPLKTHCRYFSKKS